MFTGIIEEIGIVRNIQTGDDWAKITIGCKTITTDINKGDSICVNGVCLTATDYTANTFTADAMCETIKRSTLKELKADSQVNLERAVTLRRRFGGHIVSGHIDGIGRIEKITKSNISTKFVISAPENIIKYIVPKGSVAVDGISLTIGEVSSESFEIFIIPHTGMATTLTQKKPGCTVNLESDIIAKYVEKLTTQKNKSEAVKNNNGDNGIDYNFLQRHGFM